MNRWMRAFGAAVLCAAGAAAQKPATAPTVVSLTPPHDSVEVDADRVGELVVVFDRPMSKKGYSFCGGGPTFPKVSGARWKGDRTCVLSVELEPGHSYRMSLNCPSAQSFRSAEGAVLESVPWAFSTLPEKLLPKTEQRRLNRAALEALFDTLATRYSYYDHRGIDWEALEREHREEILGTRTTQGWMRAVGAMLRPTQDLHLYLKSKGATVATGIRRVDSMFRRDLLSKDLIGIDDHGRGLGSAATKDGIAYLAIGSFTSAIDFDKVDELLASYRDARALILDVRPNSGGDELLARRVAAWFVEGDKVYAKNDYRIGEGAEGFGRVLERSISGNTDKKQLRIPVVVLMGPACMSSCEAFLLMMKQAEDCTLIGQRSWGSSGNPKPHELPNGVTVFVPSWRAMRPDGSLFEGEGIAPDVEVEVTAEDLRQRDPVLEAALARLRR